MLVHWEGQMDGWLWKAAPNLVQDKWLLEFFILSDEILSTIEFSSQHPLSRWQYDDNMMMRWFDFEQSELWLEFHQGNVFGGQAPVTNPLSINLRLQHGESILCQPCADAMKPEITATLTQDGLVILVHLQTDNAKKKKKSLVRYCFNIVGWMRY